MWSQPRGRFIFKPDGSQLRGGRTYSIIKDSKSKLTFILSCSRRAQRFSCRFSCLQATFEPRVINFMLSRLGNKGAESVVNLFFRLWAITILRWSQWRTSPRSGRNMFWDKGREGGGSDSWLLPSWQGEDATFVFRAPRNPRGNESQDVFFSFRCNEIHSLNDEEAIGTNDGKHQREKKGARKKTTGLKVVGKETDKGWRGSLFDPKRWWKGCTREGLFVT